MDPFLGEIRAFGFYYPPSGWALCNGAILPIQQNTALFALLGTQYGGNGTTTFALPNLQGSIIIGVGQGIGLSNYVQGQVGGSATVTLLPAQSAAHTHTLPAGTTVTAGAGPSPSTGLATAAGRVALNLYATPATQASSPATMATGSVSTAGGSQPHNNMAPYLAINYCIALQGIFPSRP